MCADEEPAEERVDEEQVELEGQTSINELLEEMGERPVHPIVVAEPTDEEIADFLARETGGR